MGMNIDLDLDVDRVKSEAEKMKENAHRDIAEGMLTEANKTVPHDEGTLERSGTADYNENMAAVGYDTPYAIRLHESAPGEYSFRGNGRRKWLEQTINEEMNNLLRYINRNYDF